MNLTSEAERLLTEFNAAAKALSASPDAEAVEALRIAFLGRKGKVTALLEGLRSAPPAEKPAAGKAINLLKQSVEAGIRELEVKVQHAALDRRLNAAPIDVSLPVEAMAPRGSLHPVTLMRQELLSIFRHMGFTVYDGPEIDFERYNFDALNFQSDHPARDMQDTFFLAGKPHGVLRTHTSNIQIHCMLNEKPPLRIVAPGRVFRCDSDPTHTPMFHQIEAFVVDRGISFAHMKGVIDAFLKALFGKNLKTRFRPSFFPFTEPSAEMDLQCAQCAGKGCRLCKQTGWLEIGGCGMIHPNVFEAVEYDSEILSGFAFGFGIDRMAMLRYNLPDLRQLFEGHHGFLGRFPIVP